MIDIINFQVTQCISSAAVYGYDGQQMTSEAITVHPPFQFGAALTPSLLSRSATPAARIINIRPKVGPKSDFLHLKILPLPQGVWDTVLPRLLAKE